MRWTHVWMRDGILPLDRERLKTTSTVKTQVSQVGQAGFLFSSEKLLLAPWANATHITFNAEGILIVLCCLIMLGMVWKGLSWAAHVPLASKRCQVLLPELWWPWSSGPLFSPAPPPGSRAGVKEHGGAAASPPSATQTCRETLTPKQQGRQQGWDRPAQGVPSRPAPDCHWQGHMPDGSQPPHLASDSHRC